MIDHVIEEDEWISMKFSWKQLESISDLHFFLIALNLAMLFNGNRAKTPNEKAEQWTESAKETAHNARDKTANAAQSTKESAQHGQQQATGFIQQTGESVKNMAQGAVDGVKNTLGINEKK